MSGTNRKQFRALSWWVAWEDLELGNPVLSDRIRKYDFGINVRIAFLQQCVCSQSSLPRQPDIERIASVRGGSRHYPDGIRRDYAFGNQAVYLRAHAAYHGAVSAERGVDIVSVDLEIYSVLLPECPDFYFGIRRGMQ